MSDTYILDEDHNIMPEGTTDAFAWKNKDNEHLWRVGESEIGDVTVSTVFLVLDHQYGHGRPLLFETMVFGGKNDSYCERYHTWDEAERGHKRIVKSIEQGGDLYKTDLTFNED